MNPNYDMTKLRSGLDQAWKFLKTTGQNAMSNEVEEALHVLATQAHWIAKARPMIYTLVTHITTDLDQKGPGDFFEAADAGIKLLDGWLPAPTHEVSFDGQNWIDLPRNREVPDGMQSREKLKGGK